MTVSLRNVSARPPASRTDQHAAVSRSRAPRIRRVDLRKTEGSRQPSEARHDLEFWQDDFPELKA